MLKALKNLFRFGEKSRYKNRQVTNDLSLLVSDVHSHLVPGVDDGSPDMDTSIALIRRLQDLGYTKLVTTPHIMADLYPNTPEILNPRFEELKAEVAKRLPLIELFLGAEYFLDTELLELLSKPEELLTFPCKDPLNGEQLDMILFEFAFHLPPNFDLLSEIVFKMQTSGLTPVLAHIARYPYFHKDRSKLKELHTKGVILTVNAATLFGSYGNLAKETALFAIEKGWVRMICSDTHAPHHISAVKELVSSPVLADMLKSGTLLNSGIGVK